MTNDQILIAVQEDLLAKLLSEDALATVNVILQRKLLTSSQAQIAEVWMTMRGGKIGAGIMVGMPYLEEEATQTGISDGKLCIPIMCFEQPDTAQTTSIGTGITAEELGFIARAILRGFVMEGIIGGLFTEGRSLQATSLSEDITDVICYTLTMKAKLRQPAIVRCALPTISESALTVTLITATSGASIYYTMDGSFPGPGNSLALIYTSPFVVASGAVVRFAAYKSDLSGSNAGRALIT